MKTNNDAFACVSGEEIEVNTKGGVRRKSTLIGHSTAKLEWAETNNKKGGEEREGIKNMKNVQPLFCVIKVRNDWLL